MNYLLEFTGAVLYLALSVVLFPLFVLVQLLLLTVPAVKYTHASLKRMLRFRAKRTHHMPHVLELLFEKVRRHA